MSRCLIAALALSACAAPTGTVQVTAWGEARSVEGFTAEQTDGWTVTLDHWLTGITAVELSDPQSGEVVASVDGPWVIDWTAHPDPVDLATVEAPAGRVDVGFAFDVPAGAEPVSDIPADLVDGMAAEDRVHRIIGSATDGTTTLAFDWAFSNPVSHALCRNGLDDTPGLAVPADDTVDLQITLHADHLLWDQVGTEQADLVFGPLAQADADADGTLTLDELAEVTTLDAGYETGGFDLVDLEDFLRFTVAQAGHVNGGGLCQVRAR